MNYSNTIGVCCTISCKSHKKLK